MTVKREQLGKILVTLLQGEFDLSITVGGDTMYTTQQVYMHMLQYWDWIYHDLINPVTGHGYIYNDYVTQWAQYIAVYGPDLHRAWQAMQESYDPLHNYDMTESGADGDRTGKQTTTQTPHGKITNETEITGTDTNTTTVYKSGVDSTGDGVQTDKQVTANTPTNRKTTTNTTYDAGTDMQTAIEHTHDQTATAGSHTITGADRASEHYLERSGNIGVTTSQQMLQSEIDLRMNSQLLDLFVGRFIRMCCTFVGGAYNVDD